MSSFADTMRNRKGEALPYQSTVAVTIISKNYLAAARSLMKSIQMLHDDILLVVGLVDTVDGCFDPQAEPFHIVLAEDLGIPRWQHFAMKYDIMELNTAIKPYLLENLFDMYNAQKVIYFDPDIIVYQRLDALLALLDDNTFVLTPHLLAPLDDGKNPSERSLMMAGTYNLGFIAISRTGDWRQMLRWWQARLYNEGFSDAANGMFTDQKWIELVPSLFDKVHILRESAYNVAYWNFKNRDLSVDDDGNYRVDGKPLIFFHFSGYSVNNPSVVSKHQNRFTFDDLNEPYKRIFADYHQILESNGFHDVIEFPYAYGTFADDVKITAPVRTCLRVYDVNGDVWENPFDITQKNSFREWARQPIKDNTKLSPIALTVYRMNPYIRKLFQDIMSEQGQLLYLTWFVEQANKGVIEPYFAEPTRVYLEKAPQRLTLKLRSQWQLIASKIMYYLKNPNDLWRVFRERHFGRSSPRTGKPPKINIEQQRVNVLVEDEPPKFPEDSPHHD